MMTFKDYVELASTILVLTGLIIAILQLRFISRDLRVGQQANLVGVISHCVNRYEHIVSDLDDDTKPTSDEIKVGSWWYRYWDLITEEFNFFLKGLLDPDIFEIWMNELATIYHDPPKSGMSTRSQSHKQYLAVTLPHYNALHQFFERLDKSARINDPETRAEEIHSLISKFAPTNAPFELERFNKR